MVDNKSKVSGAVSDPVTIITNHGAIERMVLPLGFVRVELPEKDTVNNYLECKVPGTDIRICYEQTRLFLAEEDRAELARLFSSPGIQPGSSSRQLNIFSDPNQAIDDGGAYGALCQCFVFGGRLVRNGSSIDEENSTWEMRTVGDDEPRVVLAARLRFHASTGKRSPREALLIMPQAPGDGGNAYIWLEGTSSEVARLEKDFLNAAATGQFRSL